MIIDLVDAIVDCCCAAGSACIPSFTNSPNKPAIPGWSEHVKGYRQSAMFWHQLWKNNGSPSQGCLADIRRSTRLKYHNAVKKVKRDHDRIVSQRIEGQLLNQNSKSFWKFIKKTRTGGSRIPSSIDFVSGDDNIATLFSNKYKKLYNTTPHNVGKMAELKQQINEKIDNECTCGSCSVEHFININHVRACLKKLKSKKSDGTCSMSTDHLINYSDNLVVHLSLLFTCMLRHGFSPHQFNIAKLTPIPKSGKKSVHDSNNYRAIAMGNVIGKLLDNVIMHAYNSTFQTSHMQFGFKPGNSTTAATFCIDETVKYYNNNNSDVYVVLLDASKAFDMVDHCKLFEVLLSKNMCPMLLRLLYYMYFNQNLAVKWNNVDSNSNFSCTNGVKQGGVLSPILFTMYIDILLQRLKASKLGCHIGTAYGGALGYADDVALVAPTLAAVKSMLGICESFAKEYNLKFNASKSQLLLFETKQTNYLPQLSFMSNIIPVEKNAIHLGNIIGRGANRERILAATDDMVRKTNVLLSLFNSFNLSTRYKIFKSIAMSLYGSQLWDTSKNDIHYFYVNWRKCIRRLCKVPFKTHSAFLPYLVNDLRIETQLYLRFLKFFMSGLHSHNTLLSTCVNLALAGSNSGASNTVNNIMQIYNFSKTYLCNAEFNEIKKAVLLKETHFADETVQPKCVFISELLDNLHNMPQDAPFNTQDDLKFILNYLCTQ